MSDLAPLPARAAAPPRVALECGHHVPMPWDTAPIVAAAVLTRHRADCDRGSPSIPAPGRGALPWPVPP